MNGEYISKLTSMNYYLEEIANCYSPSKKAKDILYKKFSREKLNSIDLMDFNRFARKLKSIYEKRGGKKLSIEALTAEIDTFLEEEGFKFKEERSLGLLAKNNYNRRYITSTF